MHSHEWWSILGTRTFSSLHLLYRDQEGNVNVIHKIGTCTLYIVTNTRCLLSAATMASHYKLDNIAMPPDTKLPAYVEGDGNCSTLSRQLWKPVGLKVSGTMLGALACAEELAENKHLYAKDIIERATTLPTIPARPPR